jgi:hypothetical protein
MSASVSDALQLTQSSQSQHDGPSSSSLLMVENFASRSGRWEKFPIWDFPRFLKERTKQARDPFNTLDHVAVRVQSSVKQHYFREVTLEHLFNRYVSGQKEFYQCYINDDRTCSVFTRLFLCFRCKEYDFDQGVNEYLALCGDVEEQMRPRTNWTIICRSEDDNMMTVLMVSKIFFDLAERVVEWLKEIDNRLHVTARRMVQTNHVAPCLGGLQRENETPFRLYDPATNSFIDHANVTIEQFRGSFVSCYDHADMRLLPDIVRNVGGEVIDDNNEEAYYEDTDDRGGVPNATKTKIEEILRSYGNERFNFVSAQRRSCLLNMEVESTVYMMEYKFLNRDHAPGRAKCAHGKFHRVISISYCSKSKLISVVCGCSFKSDADWWSEREYRKQKIYSQKPEEQARLDFVLETLPELMLRDLCRPDMPITVSDWEKRMIEPSKLDFTNFFFHPEPYGTGYNWNMKIWEFLSSAEIFIYHCEMFWLTCYLNLFICTAEGDYFVKNRKGYERAKKTEMETKVDCLKYPAWKGKKDRQLTFLPFVGKNRPYNDSRFRRQFQKTRIGEFRMFDSDNLPICDFNVQGTLDVNVIKCKALWDALKIKMPHVTEFIRRLWDTWLYLAVYHEPLHMKEECASWIQRWGLEKVFCTGKKLYCNLTFSGKMGAGKTWFFQILEGIFGTNLCKMKTTSKAFMETGFLGELLLNGTCLVIFDEDNIDPKNTELLNKLKAWTTMTTLSESVKNGANFLSAHNNIDFGRTVNPSKSGLVIPIDSDSGVDRRNAIWTLPSLDEQQRLFSDPEFKLNYCPSCRPNQRTTPGCSFCINTPAFFWTMLQQYVKGFNGENGLYWEPFVGMLYEQHLLNESLNLEPLQPCMPVTVEMLHQRELAIGPVEKWYDACVERGFIFRPESDHNFAFGTSLYFCKGLSAVIAGKNFPRVNPNNLGPDNNNHYDWSANEWIPLETLVKCYEHETKRTNTRLDWFQKSLIEVLHTRAGFAPSTFKDTCVKFTFKSYDGNNTWEEKGETKDDMELICVPKLSKVAVVNAINNTEERDRARRHAEDALLELTRHELTRGNSMSNFDLRRSRNASNAASSTSTPEPPPTIIVGNDENPMEAHENRVTVTQVIRQLNRQDQDHNRLVAIRKAKRVQVGGDVGIARDELGEGEDEEEQPRGKHGKFVDYEAEEAASGEAEAEDALNEMELDLSE